MGRSLDFAISHPGLLLRTDSSAGIAILPDTLASGEQLLGALLRCSNVGFAICNSHIRYQAVNRTVARMNGVPAKLHLGRSLSEILGTAASVVGSAVERVLSTGMPLRGLEFSAVLPSRTKPGRWIEDYFPLRDKDGKVKQVAVIIVEVQSEREQGELDQSLLRLRSVLGSEGSRSARRSLRLTPREREIIPLLAEGKTNRQAAAILGLSVRTIESHRAEIMRRLKLNSLSDLIRYAIRQGIVSL